MSPTFVKKSPMPASTQALFDWHERPGAFQRLTPPWERVTVLEHTGGIRDGAQVELKINLAGPLAQRWRLVHRDYVYGEQFKDVQQAGMFAAYAHTHRMHANGQQSVLEDRIEYELPLGRLGHIFGGWFVRRKFERLFTYRHAVTANDLRLHQAYHDQPRLQVALLGAQTLVGQALQPFLTTGGHTVTVTGLDQGIPPTADAIVYCIDFENDHQVAHRQLVATLDAGDAPPRVVILVALPGDDGLLAAWQAALEPARQAGSRVVTLRLGTVLALAGGVLAALHLPFQLGLGGVLGDGQADLNWISLDDVLGVINHALLNGNLAGEYQTVAPQAVRQQDFVQTLGRVLGRPTRLPLPDPAQRWLFGREATAFLTGGPRLSAQTLLDSGYQFLYPDLEPALRHLLGRRA